MRDTWESALNSNCKSSGRDGFMNSSVEGALKSRGTQKPAEWEGERSTTREGERLNVWWWGQGQDKNFRTPSPQGGVQKGRGIDRVKGCRKNVVGRYRDAQEGGQRRERRIVVPKEAEKKRQLKKKSYNNGRGGEKCSQERDLAVEDSKSAPPGKKNGRRVLKGLQKILKKRMVKHRKGGEKKIMP